MRRQSRAIRQWIATPHGSFPTAISPASAFFAVLYGLIPPTIAFIGWFWPSKKETAEDFAAEVAP